MAEREIDWKGLAKPLELGTGQHHKLTLKRETIPIIFLPGIMGTCLRRTDGEPIWDPNSPITFMLWNYGFFWTNARDKQEKLLGKKLVHEPGKVVPWEDSKSQNKAVDKEFPEASKRGWGSVFWES